MICWSFSSFLWYFSLISVLFCTFQFLHKLISFLFSLRHNCQFQPQERFWLLSSLFLFQITIKFNFYHMFELIIIFVCYNMLFLFFYLHFHTLELLVIYFSSSDSVSSFLNLVCCWPFMEFTFQHAVKWFRTFVWS